MKIFLVVNLLIILPKFSYANTYINNSVEIEVNSQNRYYDYGDSVFINVNIKNKNRYGELNYKIYVINPIYSNFELEPGDFLVKNGHVTFYLGGTDDNGSDGFSWGEVRTKFPQRTLFTRGNNNRFYENFWRVYRYIGRER